MILIIDDQGKTVQSSISKMSLNLASNFRSVSMVRGLLKGHRKAEIQRQMIFFFYFCICCQKVFIAKNRVESLLCEILVVKLLPFLHFLINGLKYS